MKIMRTFMITCLLFNGVNTHADHIKNESIHSTIPVPQKSIGCEYSFGIIPLRKVNEIWQTLILCENTGRWSFPKGHIEDSDPSPIDTAERELFEETTLSVATYFNALPLSVTYISNSTGLKKTVTLFCATVTGTVQLENQALDGVWINVGEIQEKITEYYYQDLISELQSFVQTLTSQKNLSDIIAEKKNQLATQKADTTMQSFADFDPQFTPEEHEVFKKLHIKTLQPYNAYGSIEGNEATIENDVREYIESLGNDPQTSLIAAQAIVRISKNIVTGFDLPAAWITLRASQPNHHFDIPRWHTDGHKNLRYKVVITLQGPGTLLSEVSEETRKEYQKRDTEGREKITNLYPDLSRREQSIKHSDGNRELFVSLFPADTIQQAATRQGIIFIVGNEHTAAFHSEPPITTFRLFMSVMPGTVEHIEDWRKQTNK